MPQTPARAGAPGAVPVPAGPTPARRRAGSGFVHVVREVVIVVGTALALSLLVKTFLFQAFWIPSGSMENTLVIGDRVVVSKLTPGPFELERGDIIVFQDPGNWLPPTIATDRGPVGNVVHGSLEFVGLAPTEDDKHLIKRVIGLPGDHVECCAESGNLLINGTEVSEPYLREGEQASEQSFDVVVPDGRVWVMGDHRSNSGDSRFHDDGSGWPGSVPEELIVGKSAVLVWPVDRWTWFGEQDEVFADVRQPTGE